MIPSPHERPSDRDPELVVPVGQSTGCLPRTSKPGDWAPLLSEHIKTIPRGEWPDLIEKQGPGLRSIVPFDALSQGSVGSCAAEACTGATMTGREVAGLEHVLLNPWSLYYFSSGGVDRGSGVDENLRLARDQGICPEAIWPRSKSWRTRPSGAAMEAAQRFKIAEWYDITTTDEIGTALLEGFAVVFGWSGHSVFFTHLLNTTTAQYLNSWSPRWGDRGYGTLALSKVNFRYGAYALRVPTFTDAA